MTQRIFISIKNTKQHLLVFIPPPLHILYILCSDWTQVNTILPGSKYGKRNEIKSSAAVYIWNSIMFTNNSAEIWTATFTSAVCYASHSVTKTCYEKCDIKNRSRVALESNQKNFKCSFWAGYTVYWKHHWYHSYL